MLVEFRKPCMVYTRMPGRSICIKQKWSQKWKGFSMVLYQCEDKHMTRYHREPFPFLAQFLLLATDLCQRYIELAMNLSLEVRGN